MPEFKTSYGNIVVVKTHSLMVMLNDTRLVSANHIDAEVRHRDIRTPTSTGDSKIRRDFGIGLFDRSLSGRVMTAATRSCQAIAMIWLVFASCGR